MSASKVPTEAVEKDGKQFLTVQEGKAVILVPQGAKIGEDKSEVQQVFYNPIQQFNRDLSVLALKTYGEDIITKKRKHAGKGTHKRGEKRKRGAENSEVGGAAAEREPGQEPPEEAPVPAARPPQFRILDALSASGLRALRYGHELPFVTSITANDLSKSAAESIQANAEHNGLADKIEVSNDDALAHMYRSIANDLSSKHIPGYPGKSLKYDAIDLDPYGTGAQFFDAAVQAVRDDGGLLCITCTDSAVWAGHSYGEKAFALYGGTPIKGTHTHEVGLRLILHAVASSAARYGLDIEPLLSLSIDYYIRMFVRVNKSPQAVKFHGAKTMLLYSCDTGCGAFQTQYLMKSKVTANKRGSGFFYKHSMAQGPASDQHCRHCGFKTRVNGPMYGGKLHSPEFVERLLKEIASADPKVYKTLPRMQGMVQTALEECMPGLDDGPKVNEKDDKAAAIEPYPFYVIPSRLAGSLSCQAPPIEMFRGALLHLGYRGVRSHCRPGSIKTDAPWSTIWFIMTEWVRQKAPVTPANIRPSSAAWKILSDAGLLGDERKPTVQEEDTSVANGQAEAMDVETLREDAKSSPDISIAKEALTEEELRKTLVFDDSLARLGREPADQRIKRYQVNPEPDWGPMKKARAQ